MVEKNIQKLDQKVFSNIMNAYNQEIDGLFKEYNRTIGGVERLSVTPAQFVSLLSFFYQKKIHEK